MKKFPLLIFLLIVTGVGVATYFIFFNKKKKAAPENNLVFYTLTVQVGENATGTPHSGTYTYTAGSSIAYEYTSLRPEHYGAWVTINDNRGYAQGQIVLDQDKTIKVYASAYDIRGQWLITVIEEQNSTFPCTFIGERKSGVFQTDDGYFKGPYWVNFSTIKMKVLGGDDDPAFTFHCSFYSYDLFSGDNEDSTLSLVAKRIIEPPQK